MAFTPRAQTAPARSPTRSVEDLFDTSSRRLFVPHRRTPCSPRHERLRASVSARTSARCESSSPFRQELRPATAAASGSGLFKPCPPREPVVSLPKVERKRATPGKGPSAIRLLDILEKAGTVPVPKDRTPKNIDRFFTSKWLAKRSHERYISDVDKAQRRTYAGIFALLDRDNLGTIDTLSFQVALRMLKFQLDRQELNRLLVEKDALQFVSRETFVDLMMTPELRQAGRVSLGESNLPLMATAFGMRKDMATRIFSVLDNDNSGALDFDEIHEGFRRMGFFYTEVEMRHLLHGQGTNGDYSINDFIFLLSSLDDLAQRRQQDEDGDTYVESSEVLQRIRGKVAV